MTKKKATTKQQLTSPFEKERPPKKPKPKRKRNTQSVRLAETATIRYNPDLEERIIKQDDGKKRRRKSFFKKLRGRFNSFLIKNLKKWRGL